MLFVCSDDVGVGSIFRSAASSFNKVPSLSVDMSTC